MCNVKGQVLLLRKDALWFNIFKCNTVFFCPNALIHGLSIGVWKQRVPLYIGQWHFFIISTLF